MTDNKNLPKIRYNSPHEEAEIRRKIAEDPDTWEAPAEASALKRGRPPGRKKMQVTVSLDKDLVEALKTPDPKGWQTRLNAAARAGLKTVTGSET